MSVTGFDTFVSKARRLGRVIDTSYELRVMLMNPYGAGAMRRVQSLGDPTPLLKTYCQELKSQPEYVFALQKDKPTQGLFSAFYVHFLNHWSDPRHPEYDFATRELIYRNDKGNEVKRLPFPPRQASSETTDLVLLAR